MDKKSKKLVLVLFVIYLVMCNTYAFAQQQRTRLGTGNASVMKVNLSKFELDNGEGSTAVTAFEGTSATLDIASAADNNTSVGNFMSGLIIPDGNYSRVKPTPSGVFILSGSVLYNGTTYYTTSTPGPQTGCLSSTTGPAQECTVTISVTEAPWETMLNTITVVDGTPNYKIRVKFNTSNSLGLYDMGDHYELFPEPPQTTMSLVSQ